MVAALATGLLSMHVLPGLMATRHGSLVEVADVAGHHTEARPDSSASDPASSVIFGMPHAIDHLQQMLDCILFLAGTVALAVAVRRSSRVRHGKETRRTAPHQVVAYVQRPPPSAVRLSLVGLSRC